MNDNAIVVHYSQIFITHKKVSFQVNYLDFIQSKRINNNAQYSHRDVSWGLSRLLLTTFTRC